MIIKLKNAGINFPPVEDDAPSKIEQAMKERPYGMDSAFDVVAADEAPEGEHVYHEPEPQENLIDPAQFDRELEKKAFINLDDEDDEPVKKVEEPEGAEEVEGSDSTEDTDKSDEPEEKEEKSEVTGDTVEFAKKSKKKNRKKNKKKNQSKKDEKPQKVALPSEDDEEED